MSSTNLPTPSAVGNKDMKKMRGLSRMSLPYDIWERILVQYLLPECTWDSIEECVGWCREMIVDPAPLKRIGREWIKRAKGMRTLLEALYVRTVEPRDFCRGTIGVPHPVAILLGGIIERDQDWRVEVRSQSPSIVHKNFLMEYPISWMHLDGSLVKRTIDVDSPFWCSIENPGVPEEYFQLWRHLNMLYERLSLPWRWWVRPTPSYLGFESLKPIKNAINGVYFEIENLWRIRKGNIQNHDALPLEEQVRAYDEGFNLQPYLGRRTPWMRLDYDWIDTRMEEEVGEHCHFSPKQKRPRKLYRQHCTWRELSILNRECSVDGIPWVRE